MSKSGVAKSQEYPAPRQENKTGGAPIGFPSYSPDKEGKRSFPFRKANAPAVA